MHWIAALALDAAVGLTTIVVLLCGLWGLGKVL